MADNTPDSNESPQIPSFKPTRKSEDEGKGGSSPLSGLGKPKASGTGSPLSSLGKPAAIGTKGSTLPSTGGSGGFKFPGFGGGKKGAGVAGMRIRGMGGSGGSLLDRLKNLRRKDLMFIGAGLATLMMAPVAEHFMMTPEENVGALEEGFDSKGPLFPDGSTVYESGTGGFSPGGLVGAGTDVITPLNVRDPSALVMGPGARQKPEAVIEPPPAASTNRDDDSSASKWKDALAESAKSGVREAVKKSPKLPRPSVKMQGALRGLSALSGSSKGGGASFKLPGLSASNVPNRARGSDSLTTSQATPGYRGAARRSNASGSGLEGLRGAAGRQADMFGKAGASDGLQTAANVALPFPGGGGRGGYGGPGGDSGPGKNPGGNQIKENKQLGESLEFLRRKMEQEKAIGLKWKKKEWNSFGRQKALEEGAIKLMFDAFGKIIIGPIAKMGEALAGQLTEPGGAGPRLVKCQGAGGTIIDSYIQSGTRGCSNGVGWVKLPGSESATTDPNCQRCSISGGSPAPGGPQTNPNDDASNPWESPLGNSDPATTPEGDVFKICETIKAVSGAQAGPAFTAAKQNFLVDAQRLVVARMNLNSNKGSGSACLAGSEIAKTDYVKEGDPDKTYTANDFTELINGVQEDLRKTQIELAVKTRSAKALANGESTLLGTAKTAVDTKAGEATLETVGASIQAIQAAAKGPEGKEFAALDGRVETEVGKLKGEVTIEEVPTRALATLQTDIAALQQKHEGIHKSLTELGQGTLSPLQARVPGGLSDDAKTTLDGYAAALQREHTVLTNQWNGALGRSQILQGQHPKAETARDTVSKTLDAVTTKAGTAKTTAAQALTQATAMVEPTYIETTPTTPPVRTFKQEQWNTDATAVASPLETAGKQISPTQQEGLSAEFEATREAIRAVNPGVHR